MSEHEPHPPEEHEPQPEPTPADAPQPEPPEEPHDPAATAAEREQAVREAQAANPGVVIHNPYAKPVDPNHPELPRVPRDGTEDDEPVTAPPPST